MITASANRGRAASSRQSSKRRSAATPSWSASASRRTARGSATATTRARSGYRSAKLENVRPREPVPANAIVTGRGIAIRTLFSTPCRTWRSVVADLRSLFRVRGFASRHSRIGNSVLSPREEWGRGWQAHWGAGLRNGRMRHGRSPSNVVADAIRRFADAIIQPAATMPPAHGRIASGRMKRGNEHD